MTTPVDADGGMPAMNITLFASSLASAYWNGAPIYYRSIVRALADRGHNVTCFEPEMFERPRPRAAVDELIERSRDADLVIKASGVGVHDQLLDRLVLELQAQGTLVAFWDLDPQATLNRIEGNPDDAFRALVRRYDVVLAYGGGTSVVNAYRQLGAMSCVPIYNALDPLLHHRVPPDPRFEAALGFLGNRLPDRERRVDELLLGAARLLPDQRIVVGGAGWHDKPLPGNVEHLGHVFTRDHNAFHGTPRATLHLSRDSVAIYGCSPSMRLFNAAGAGACLISDAWLGIEQFLEPGLEVLVARSGDDVAHYVASLDPVMAQEIGRRAQARMLREHTYAHRARDIEAAVSELPLGRPTRWRARGRSAAMRGRSTTSYLSRSTRS